MATKKATSTKATKTANKYDDIFNICPFPIASDFEQQNFESLAGSAYARYVIQIINRIRKIDSDLELETRTFEKNCLDNERVKLYKFLDNQDPYSLEAAVKNWEAAEDEYWANALGKQSAIEILTYGKVTYDTMSKMVKLPEELYIKSTQICVRLANAIKEATIKAEEEIGFTNGQDENSDSSEPKKLNLKKVK